MIGICRTCKRVLSSDEARCPFCGEELPWSAVRRVSARWPAAARRWMVVAGVALALAVAVSLCSAGEAEAAPVPAECCRT